MNHLVEEAAATAHKLAILQAYPLGTLDVTFAHAPHMGVIGQVTALDVLTPRGPEAFVLTDERGLSSHWIPVTKVLPFLKTFSSLCTPLEDGTGRIPAVEVARLGMIDEENKEQLDWPKATAEVQALSKGQKFILVKIPDKNPDYMPRQYYIWDNYAMGGGLNTMVIIDQLRAWHFALPVNGRPLIEGRDYLPK